jgi:hypothetical protein
MRRPGLLLAVVAMVAGLGAGALAGCEEDGSSDVRRLGPTPTTADPSGSDPPTVASLSRLPPAPSPTLGPAETYQALAADWQRARSRFFGTISSGRPLTLARQRATAAEYLAALRRFATGVRAHRWPPAARAAVAELLAANAQQQSHLVAMTRAASPFAFTSRLADYGVDAARENRAVAAVTRALG